MRLSSLRPPLIHFVPKTRSISCTRPSLAGHNKWSKIKDKKGANDANKSAVYTRATQDIVNAARIGGSVDPEKNISLAAVLKRLKGQNVPKENIAKALAKASAFEWFITSKQLTFVLFQANKAKNSGETTVYEAIACNVVALIIECSTENATRTVQTLRAILSSKGARTAPVGYMFQRHGHVKIQVDKDASVDELVDIALDNGSEDFEMTESEEMQEISFTCGPTDLSALTTALMETKKCQVLSSELVYNPLDSPELSDEDMEKVNELVEALEANEDTMRVWTNLRSTS